MVGTDGRNIHDVSQRTVVELNGSVLLADGRPLFPRAVDYRGEPLAVIRSLGFNAIRLASPPNRALLEEARREGLWIVSPPPTAESLDGKSTPIFGDLGPEYDRVLAWDLGEGLTKTHLEAARRASDALRRADSHISRPILASAEEEVYAYSRSVDVLVLTREPLATSFEQNDYGTWMRERMRLARPGTPFWATIQTQLRGTCTADRKLVGRPSVGRRGRCRPNSALVYTALASGSGGVMFRSHSRLDADDAATLALESLTLRS